MVLGPVMVRRSTVCACGLIGVVLNGGAFWVATFTGAAERLNESCVALSPDLMLVVSITRVLPSQWATLSPIQASTFFGHLKSLRSLVIGITRVPSISSSITM